MKDPNRRYYISDRPTDGEVESVEVYAAARQRGSGVVPIGRRRFVVGIATLIMVVVVLVAGLWSAWGGSGSSSAIKSSPGTAPRSTQVSSASSAPCVHALGYSGLGARFSRFETNYTGSMGPSGPAARNWTYEVTGTARRCVTALSVQNLSTPQPTRRQLLLLVSNAYFPRDAKELVSMDSCVLWKSAALQRATGRPYAMAVVVPEAGSAAATRGAVASRARASTEIQATSVPTC